MAKLIRLTSISGETFLLNTGAISRAMPAEEGSVIHLLEPEGDGVARVHVKERLNQIGAMADES